MAAPVLIKNRYEIRDVLGRGGMGVVYKAFDALMRREVALKTLRDVASSVFVDLFYRECSVLTAMVHPNIVEIFDMGEFEEDGVLKPYFVMPLLPGRTLYDLIYPSGKPVAVERATDIISQACRGLHAAHECGLLHRDIKPRNIFVMRDDAVKLIDFGVVRLLGHQTIGAPGTLGTLHYMAPEQISMKPLTARSDIFSLATVCYEALTSVHPFMRDNETETAAAVAEYTPALVSALNPLVSRPLAQAVAQAMAKDPRNRFESAAAFADALQRGLRNERAGASLLTNPQNRLARAQRSFARGDYEFTQEIIQQLEAEGVEGPEVQQLRSELAEAVRKQQAEVQLTTARRYFEQEEYVLALRRVAELLDANPSHQAAMAFRNQIEDKLNDVHVADSLKRAANHLETGDFHEARRLIASSLELQPENTEAQRLLEDAEQRAKDWPQQRQQQEELFQAAQTAYFEGRFEPALRMLEQLADSTRKSRAAGERVSEYKDFYRRVRVDFDALQAKIAEARKQLTNDDVESAWALSERLREQFPQDQDVHALGKDVAARRGARERDYRNGIAASIANEPDLNKRLGILNQAVRSRPTDEFLHEERQKLQSLVQRITELVQRAQGYEAAGRFEYAIEEWLCVGDLYSAYPGLPEQLARVKKAWKAEQDKAKSELRANVSQALRQGKQDFANDLLRAAEPDFEGDETFVELQTLTQRAGTADKQVDTLLERMRIAENEKRFDEIPELSQMVADLSQPIEPLRAKSFDALTKTASRLVAINWRVAQQVSLQAARVGAVPTAVDETITQHQREEEVREILAEDRAGRANLDAYRQRVAAMIQKYPGEARLEDRLRLIDAALVDQRLQDQKRSCAAELALMCQEMGDANDHRRLWDTYLRAKTLAAPFADDHEIGDLLEAIREQGSQFEEAANALTRDRIKDSLAVCDSMLRKYPGHVLFQKLRDQTDVRHRQLGEEYLARVERWLASESDVYQRELILQKALDEYPFETRYEEELRQLQREKGVADSIAAKARDYEKRGQTAEAVVQWRLLRNLHPTYPNLQGQIDRCETILDLSQRKTRAQRLLAQGETCLDEGQFAQGYQMVHEAFELSRDMPDLLSQAAPQLVAAARSALADSPKLSEAMLDLAQNLDEGLRIPKDVRARITEARKAEDLNECLESIRIHHQKGDLSGALGLADEFLTKFPGVKQVESAQARLLWEIGQDRKQEVRSRTFDQFRQMELNAASMGPSELVRLRQSVQEIGRAHLGDEEISQRASTLDSLFGSLAEVRSFLQSGQTAKAEEVCTRAFDKFPDHPLFKAAQAEAGKQKSKAAAAEIEEVKQQLNNENDLFAQNTILQAALVRFPDEPSFINRQTTINANQAVFHSRIEKAHDLETKRLFGEALKEWETIGRDYPWFTSVPTEIERITSARRKEKQEALDRWFRQVEQAIDNGDYDTAGTMLRQAAQQQPDRQLHHLEAKLNEGLQRKRDSDAKFTEGSRLLSNGDLIGGGSALFRSFELQPKDQQKADAIAEQLLEQIRLRLGSDLASCENLLLQLNRVRPNQALPPDIEAALNKKAKGSAAKKSGNRHAMARLETIVDEVASAQSPKALMAVRKKLKGSKLLDSRDPEVTRTATELLRKIDAGFSAMGIAPPKRVKRSDVKTREGFSVGAVVAAAIILLSLAGVVFFLSRPSKTSNPGVPVSMNITPDHTSVEMDGHKCITPDCQFSLKPGDYLVKLRKTGYLPKDVFVPVKPNDTGAVTVTAELEPLTDPIPPFNIGDRAKIVITGALPGTRVRMDGLRLGEVSKDGLLTVYIPPGRHVIDLSLDGFDDHTITKEFVRGESVTFAKQDVQLERRKPDLQR